MTDNPINRLAARLRLALVADWLAVATAALLPWSTSATGILLALWLIAILPTLEAANIRRELLTAAAGLPVLLVAFGILGMLWADVSLIARWGGLGSFLKLLFIPLLFLQFRRSDAGVRVLAGYLLSCAALWAVSTVILAIPPLSASWMRLDHVLLKNSATQSGEFVTCIFGLMFLAISAHKRRQWWWMLGTLALAIGMLGNMLFFATGRTALVIIPVLLVVFAAKNLTRKGAAALFTLSVVVACVSWASSPFLRTRTIQLWTDYEAYEETQAVTSSGQRVVFYETSLKLIRQAPVFGHGTGTIPALFDQEVANKSISAGYRAANPHNQTFAVAIQLGLVGAAVLWAMWIAHLLLFRGNGLAEWVGLVVVMQNIVGSLFNSHLFDFAQGWVYVLGVGVAGGMVFKNRVPISDDAASKQSS
jgi:O-antigen ligase